MINKLRAFWALSCLDQRLFLQALLLLPLTALALRLLDFKRTQALLQRWLPLSQRVPPDLKQRAHHTAVMVELATSYGLYHASCLKRSLVLQALLRRQGIESDLRIGIRKEAGQFQAHAWLEYEGIVLNDREDIGKTYATFPGALDLRHLGSRL